MMRIVIFGAGGSTGSMALAEATAREHCVTSPRSAEADITDPKAVARAAAGRDVAIAAVAPAEAGPRAFFPAAANGLVTGLQDAVVGRLVWVSIASLLPGASGIPAVDTDGFPAEYRPFSLGHRIALEVINASGLQWAAVSPAGDFASGTSPASGYAFTAVGDLTSRVTRADHARALVDLAERPGLRGEHLGVVPLPSGAQSSAAVGDGER
ncbi:NAD(P)-dependent oxidoreductase [Streptomyces sp. NPDC048751]|uniref:NAD(P)-dependent oxidoreductase n=1 Tax=Streptomyces sp. NPDC048751 TaxID=3365591 RepID=UPI0037235872